MKWETILLEMIDECPGLACLTINRPKVMNALNHQVLTELNEAVDVIEASDDIRIVIIRGAGEKAFVAGADISELKGMTAQKAYHFARFGQKTFDRIEMMNKIVIAAVGGFALGGGCELSMACDLRIASENARMGIPEVTLGTIPGYAGTQRLPRIVGLGIAKEMAFTAKPITAKRAYEVGLVNHVVETPAELMPYCIEMAKGMMKNSMLASEVCKRAMNEGMQMELHKGIEHEAALFATMYAAPDILEGVDAFLSKRKPEFKNL